MARGKSDQVNCTYSEFAQLLVTMSHELELHGCVEGWLGTERYYMPLADWIVQVESQRGVHGDLETPRFTEVLVRQQPFSGTKDLKEYVDNPIREGLVVLYAPCYSRWGKLEEATMLVGTDPPLEGLISPVSLFGKIKRRFQKLCSHPGPGPGDPPRSRVRYSDGYALWWENEGKELARKDAEAIADYDARVASGEIKETVMTDVEFFKWLSSPDP